jgi:uncharacterized protein (DUF1697 family)
MFKTAERKLFPLAQRIEGAIERTFGFRTDVILRTSAELKEMIAGNPFGKRSGIDPSKLLVTFLAAAPAANARNKVLQTKIEPEELRIHGRELYIYFPNGMGRTKLSWPTIAKMLGTSGTGRNWNSVTKLLEMAEKLEAAG